jgi:hypothetical protein
MLNIMRKSLFIVTLSFLFSCVKANHQSSCSQEIVTTNCIDQSQIDSNAICTMEYAPVCGCNDVTYGNACAAAAAGVQVWTEGECCE